MICVCRVHQEGSLSGPLFYMTPHEAGQLMVCRETESTSSHIRAVKQLPEGLTLLAVQLQTPAKLPCPKSCEHPPANMCLEGGKTKKRAGTFSVIPCHTQPDCSSVYQSPWDEFQGFVPKFSICTAPKDPLPLPVVLPEDSGFYNNRP